MNHDEQMERLETRRELVLGLVVIGIMVALATAFLGGATWLLTR